MRLFDILIMCNFKHWFRKPLQLFFLFLGISLATTLWSSIQLINTQAKKSYESATLLISSNQNKIIFKVPIGSNKTSLKKNVEKIFKVNVIKVNIINKKNYG